MEDNRILEKFELKEVSLRLACDSAIISEKKINSPEDAVSLIGPVLATLSAEAFCVINLKQDGTPINYAVVSKGCINRAMVSPAELIKLACLSNAASVILMHNHPSGSLTPGREDMATTNNIIDVFSKIGINVLDHIIIGGNNMREYYSMKEKTNVDFEKGFEKSYSEPRFLRSGRAR